MKINSISICLLKVILFLGSINSMEKEQKMPHKNSESKVQSDVGEKLDQVIKLLDHINMSMNEGMFDLTDEEITEDPITVKIGIEKYKRELEKFKIDLMERSFSELAEMLKNGLDKNMTLSKQRIFWRVYYARQSPRSRQGYNTAREL